MSVFSQRLQDCRKSKGLTQKQAAIHFAVSERHWQSYEGGTRTPTFEGLIALSDFFDVSLDYLVGRTEDVEKRGEVVYPMFAVRLKELRLEKGLDIWAFAELFNISARNYAGYEVGETMPDLPVIVAFAEYFDVPLDYLVGRSDERERR